MLEFTNEPVSVIITAIATLIASFGALEIRKGYKSGKAGEPDDKMRGAMDANTAAMLAMVEQFRHNNGLFVGLGGKVDTLASKHDQTNTNLREILQVQNNIYAEHVRGKR